MVSQVMTSSQNIHHLLLCALHVIAKTDSDKNINVNIGPINLLLWKSPQVNFQFCEYLQLWLALFL